MNAFWLGFLGFVLGYVSHSAIRWIFREWEVEPPHGQGTLIGELIRNHRLEVDFLRNRISETTAKLDGARMACDSLRARVNELENP